MASSPVPQTSEKELEQTKPEREPFEWLDDYEGRLDLHFEEGGHKRKLKRGNGNTWVPTPRERMEAAISFASGNGWEQTARYLGVHLDTARKHLREEYEFAVPMRNLALQQKLFGKAMSGDTACLIFLAKNWLGMTDRGEAGAPPPPLETAERFSVKVVYVVAVDPRANKGPPPHLLEATATEVE